MHILGAGPGRDVLPNLAQDVCQPHGVTQWPLPSMWQLLDGHCVVTHVTVFDVAQEALSERFLHVKVSAKP